MTKGNIENSRQAFERAVIARMKESGFLEIEIRVEALVRCGDGYEDEVINAGWHYWKAGIAAATPPVVALPDDATAEEILKSTIDHPNAVVMLKRLPDARASALEEAARPTAVRPGSLVNDADIRASDPPDVVVKKLDAAFDALALPIPVTPLSLETVMRRYRGTDWPDHYPWAFLNESECQGEPGPRWIVEELCRRSQAAELLAAERAEKEEWRKRYHATHERLLEADEKLHALEAKLAAAIPPSGEGA